METIVQDVVSIYVTTIRGRERTITTTFEESRTVLSTPAPDLEDSTSPEQPQATGIDSTSAINSATSLDAIIGTPTTPIPTLQTGESAEPEAAFPTDSVATQNSLQNQEDIQATAMGDAHKGLKTGAKVGIGVGVTLTVLLVLLAITCWRRHRSKPERHASLRTRTDDNDSVTVSSEKQLEATPTYRSPEEMTHPAYEAVNPRLSNPATLLGVSNEHDKDEAPTYFAVPSHLSGQKRWSKLSHENVQ